MVPMAKFRDRRRTDGSKAIRSATFRKSYWERMAELADLVVEAELPQLVEAANQANLPRGLRARLRSTRTAERAPFTVEQVDTIARQFALWTVRNSYDWRRGEDQRLPSQVVNIHLALTTGIWGLDVEQRREVEKFFRNGRPDPAEIAVVRKRVEELAGDTAAAVDFARLVDSANMPEDWTWIIEALDQVCNELDELLRLANERGRSPDWLPDPTGRHDLRYWDGSEWTVHVSTSGAQSIDPLP